MARRWRPLRPGAGLSVVARPALWRRLDDAVWHPLTTVVGGPGWGKSMAVSTWAERPDPDGVRPPLAVWLTLEPADVAPEAFWAAVLGGLRDAGAVPADGLLATLEPGPVVDPVFVDALVHAFAELREPVLVVLDDVHAVADGPVAPGLAEVLSTCDALRVVMIGRSLPDLPLARLRLAGRLAEVGPDDLALTRADAGALFEAEGIAADDDLLDTVMARTQGWAAAVRLAALQWRRRPAAETLGTLGRSGPVAEYLVQDLLDTLDADEREFLLRTGVVELVTAPLAAVLTSVDGARPTDGDLAAAHLTLERLASRNALVTAVGEGFSYHPLLRDLLRERLATRPALAAELHRRAALRLEADGHWVDGLTHAVETQDWDLVADVALRSAAARFVGEHRAALVTQLARIPRQRAQGDAALTTALAAMAYCRYDIPDLARYVAEANAALATDPAAAPGSVRRGTTVVVLRVLEASLAKLTGDADAMLAAASAAVTEVAALPAADVPAWDVYEDVAEVLTGLAEVWTGAFDTGVARLTTREALGRTTASLGLHAAALRTVGLVLAGRPREAGQAAQDVLDRARAKGWDHTPLVAGAWAALAFAALERGDTEVAAAALDTVRPTVATGAVDWPVRTAVELADVTVRQLTHGPGAAVTALADVDRRLASGRAAGVLAVWTATVAAEIHLAAGDPTAALARIGDVRGTSPTRSGLPLGDRLDVLTARCRLALGDTAAAQAVLLGPQAQLTLRAPDEADAVTGVALDLAVALVRAAAGEAGPARSSLSTALARAESRAAVRPLLAAEPALDPLLRDVAGRGGADGARAGRVLAARASSRPVTVPPAQAGGPELTGRELAVLELLPSLLTAHEIASQLHVTVHTVRHHLKSIYRKLDVGTRREAVARATELGIVAGFAPLGPGAARRPG